jgi:hypothetical protein
MFTPLCHKMSLGYKLQKAMDHFILQPCDFIFFEYLTNFFPTNMDIMFILLFAIEFKLL